MRLLLATFIPLALSFSPLWAAGTNDTTPPATTGTTTKCTGVTVWDAKTKKCVAPKESRLNDDTLFNSARELAYAGRYRDAQGVLAAMSNPTDDRVLTYLGFTHRKLGDVARGMAYYQQALVQNPDNLLARSYMGQALVAADDKAAALIQLREIQARGGQGSWAEASLRSAITTGVTYRY